MINIRFIIHLLGRLILIESVCFILCMLIAFAYGEKDAMAFLYAALITAATGWGVCFLVNPQDKTLARKDGYFTVTFVWIIFSIFGSLPFMLGGTIPNFVDAFFETMSGFSTTGSTILNDVEALPHATQFWRCLTQWLGGLGIIVIFLAILPSLGIEGRDLYVAETSGPTYSKIAATFYSSARKTLLLYVSITLLAGFLLSLSEMTIFDSICHAFTTVATGGFSTKQDSIAHWDSPYIHYVIICFMFIASINFGLTYALIKGEGKKIIKDEEFRYYILIVLVATIIISIGLFTAEWGSPEKNIRDALFQVVSIISTTGYASADYLLWPTVLCLILLVLMFLGASAGSTSGGIKIVRIVLLFKNSLMELKRIIHPNAIINVRYNGKGVSPTIMSGVMAFFILYMIVFCIGSVVMSIFATDITTVFSTVISTISNTGPGFGRIGPMYNFSSFNDGAKLFLSFLMLVGRLELFTVLVLFTPAFWKR
ncbi:MAG: TrkH family potassium uptake protein [Odoribacter sp.]|nr:TrkH family potassium uptake protein [Odoribacter sp.]